MRRLLPLLSGLLACEAPRPDTGGDTGEAPVLVVEIGAGERSFEPLQPGDSQQMVHGPQGGWHMLGSVRVTGFQPVIEVHYTITALEQDDALVSDNNYRVKALQDPEVEGRYFYPGMYGYLDVSTLAEGELNTPPELLSYQRVRYEMTVSDTDSNSASASLELVAEPDPDDLDKVPPPGARLPRWTPAGPRLP